MTARGIYVASKTQHAPMWRRLRTDGMPIISTWIDEAGPGESPSVPDLWRRNINEASHAAALIAYHEPEDSPKGALVEVGAALASGVPVFWAGPCVDQTVTAHPLVVVCASLERAFELAMRDVYLVAEEALMSDAARAGIVITPVTTDAPFRVHTLGGAVVDLHAGESLEIEHLPGPKS